MTREDKINDIMKTLKKQINSRYIIDVGPGAEFYMDATREEFDKALHKLIEEGYSFAVVPIKEVGGGYTNLELISIPGQDWEWFKKHVKDTSPVKEITNRLVYEVEDRKRSIDRTNKIKELGIKGLTNKEIANELGMTESAVRYIRKNFIRING